MLTLMRIRNYAIIEEIEVEFGRGFSVMTGETGAGKSILVDAMGLALGDRADASAVRHGADKAEISVLFDCPANHPAGEWLIEHGLDQDDSCSLRRVISAEGRSRAFINNQPVTLQDLRALGSRLIEIHGQHEHQTLLAAGEQRRLLDASGGLLDLAANVSQAYEEWQQARLRLEQRRAHSADREAQIELLKFQLGELRELSLAEGEIESLQAEHHRLANVDETLSAVETALERTYDAEEGSASALISAASHALESIDAAADAEIRGVIGQLNSANIELTDAARTLKRYRDLLEADPERLAWIDGRLARARRLAERHKVDDTALFGKQAELEAALAQLEGSDQSLESLELREAQTAEAFRQLTAKLSKARRKHAKALAARVSEQLKNLGLPDGSCSIVVEEKLRPDAHGADQIEFRVQMNPGLPAAPLARVASGGELSRVSLALQVVVGGGSTVPTFVFDEVDAGVGGRVAEIVGNRLRALASMHQVLCVTHLPQVASQGEHHYRITKQTDGTTSRTLVEPLTKEQRVEELSRMLGGVEITDKARAHAREMMARATG